MRRECGRSGAKWQPRVVWLPMVGPFLRGGMTRPHRAQRCVADIARVVGAVLAVTLLISCFVRDPAF